MSYQTINKKAIINTFLDDDSDKERHQEARRHCYYKILGAYRDK